MQIYFHSRLCSYLPRVPILVEGTVYVCVYICVCIYIYVCVYLCMYIYVCVYIYMYMCVYIIHALPKDLCLKWIVHQQKESFNHPSKLLWIYFVECKICLLLFSTQWKWMGTTAVKLDFCMETSNMDILLTISFCVTEIKRKSYAL